jgi:phenylalanyl-tRNA synthetase alpha chain
MTNPTQDFNKYFTNLDTVGSCLALRDKLMKEGRIKDIKHKILEADKSQKQQLGQQLNQLKKAVQEACDQAISKIQAQQEKDKFLDFDPSFYSQEYYSSKGHIHPVSLVLQEMVSIFMQMGFDVFDQDLLISQWANFTSVNMPEYHPARDMQDTFFLKQKDQKGEQYLMRTQMTANISKYIQNRKPPFKVIFPGLAFRNEDIDATHDINFYQLDMWLIDKKANLSQLVTLIQQFFACFFKDAGLKVRLRPSYFPFVNPGFEGDICMPFEFSKGSQKAKEEKWIEVGGAGPIHKKVLELNGLDPNEWQGIAFGFGVDRLAQIKLKTSGISQFFNANLNFLRGR